MKVKSKLKAGLEVDEDGFMQEPERWSGVVAKTR
jgi:sulfur relay (sulfurtransferase) DsrC/TusE family protein